MGGRAKEMQKRGCTYSSLLFRAPWPFAQEEIPQIKEGNNIIYIYSIVMITFTEMIGAGDAVLAGTSVGRPNHFFFVYLAKINSFRVL
jgi:hypothetical protein